MPGSERVPEDPDDDGPGGFGPGPLIGEEGHSTCTADASGVSGSASFVNAIIETKYDEGHFPIPEYVVPIPANPPPNWTVSGTLDHIGDSFTIVINEQVIGPDSITVNAAHMYMHGPAAARGDMVIGSSTCSLSSASPTPPGGRRRAFSTVEDTPLTVAGSGLLGNDTDPDATPLAATNAQVVVADNDGCCPVYTFPSDPPNGTATINADGSFIYTPDPNFFGTDTFTYVARDARGAWDDATVTVNVTAVPEDPVAGDDFDDAFKDTPLVVPASIGVLANDTDADGDGEALTAGSPTDPANGSVALNPDGSFTYTADPGFVGTDTTGTNDAQPRPGTKARGRSRKVDGGRGRPDHPLRAQETLVAAPAAQPAPAAPAAPPIEGLTVQDRVREATWRSGRFASGMDCAFVRWDSGSWLSPRLRLAAQSSWAALASCNAISSGPMPRPWPPMETSSVSGWGRLMWGSSSTPCSRLRALTRCWRRTPATTSRMLLSSASSATS